MIIHATTVRHARTRRRPSMRRIVTTMIIALAVVAVCPIGALAQSGPGDGRETLTRALRGASLPLEHGLTASAGVGTPLSGKYEINSAMLLEHQDKVFADGWWVGLWTKADSVSEFSDLEITGTVA